MQSHPAIFFSPENQGHKLETAVNIKNLKKSRNYVKHTVNGSPQRWQLMKSNSISQTNNLRIPNYLFWMLSVFLNLHKCYVFGRISLGAFIWNALSFLKFPLFLHCLNTMNISPNITFRWVKVFLNFCLNVVIPLSYPGFIPPMYLNILTNWSWMILRAIDCFNVALFKRFFYSRPLTYKQVI